MDALNIRPDPRFCAGGWRGKHHHDAGQDGSVMAIDHERQPGLVEIPSDGE